MESTVAKHSVATFVVIVVVVIIIITIPLWRKSPQWARASSFTRFLDHTQRRITVGRTPLNE